VHRNHYFRWGLAGYGDLPQRRLIDALNQPPNQVAVVWGRNSDRAAAFAEQFCIPRAAHSLHELTEDVDAVYVAVPPVAHLPVAMTAVQAGRHVLIEKPLSPTFNGYEKLLTLVAGTHVRAAVAYYRRYAPVVRRLRQLLKGGALGQIRSVELRYASPFHPQRDDPKAWRLDPAIAGGGVMADAGSHRLDLLCWLFGPAEVVDVHLQRSAPGMVERGGDMTLLFAAGFSAHCRFSWGATKSDRLVIRGDKATVTLDPLDRGRLVIETSQNSHSFDDPPPQNLHIDLVQAFSRSVLVGSVEEICTLSEAHAVDLILERAYGFDIP
jgi:predicted dehydrogenase